MNDNSTHLIVRYPMLMAVVAGVCMGVGFIWSLLWPLSLIGIALVLISLSTLHTVRQVSMFVVLSWFVKSLVAFGFIWHAYPVDWVPQATPRIQWLGIFVYWVTSSVWLALGGVVLLLAMWFLQQPNKIWRRTGWVVVPGLWLMAELAGATIFSILMIGPGSFVQSYFSFGMVGYLFGTTSLGLWLAAIWGVYGLTLVLVVCVIGTLYCSRRLSSVRFGVVLLTAYILVMISNPISAYTDTKSRHIIAVDTHFDAKLQQTPSGLTLKVATIAQAVDEAVDQAPGYVVLPEDSRYLASQFDSEYPNQAMSVFQFTHSNTNTVVIDSGRHVTPEGVVQRANIFDGTNKKIWQVDKQYLVPQGEYMPTLYNILFRVLGYGAVVNTIEAERSYIPGMLTQTDPLPENIPGILFCFESVQPNAVRALTDTRTVPFVVHPMSHAWFHTPTLWWKQMDIMLQIQARYSGVPIVSAGNMVTGKLYLPDGRIETGTVLTANDWYTLREYRF